ncbi:MAG: hypothetical protein QOG62_2140 [Thermoleophilaceae bacterium]|nr:hypothetical protein [Thermoleophilaceae bacterium]
MGTSEQGDVGTVTLVFTDLVGSTELLDQLGDERAESLRRAHFELLREAADKHSGDEVKSLGDGLMLAFRGTLQALACAAAMQKAVAAFDPGEGGLALGLRIGINVGDVANEDDDYFGTPVVIAKRLCDRAGAGEVLLSDVVRALVGTRGGHAFLDRGFLQLKGLADPLRTHQLDWDAGTGLAPRRGTRTLTEPEAADASPSIDIPLPPGLARAGEAHFVGRAAALRQLEEELELAASGERRVILLAGEPGVGKTRLSSKLALGARENGATVLFGHSDEETLVPFQPFIQAIAHYVEHAPTERLRKELGDGGRDLLRLVPELRDRMPELTLPEARDPDTERYRLFEAITNLLSASAAEAPLVLVLDDLHWADRPSLLLLRHIARAPGRAALLILGTYRDVELSRSHPLAETLSDLRRDRLFERINLTGLTQGEVEDLIAAWAGQSPPAGFAAAVWNETEGHPFFVQEILRHLLETGALYEKDGRTTTRLSVQQMGIPEGIKDVVARRLARLGEQTEDLLAVAACVGREFSSDILELVQHMPSAQVLTALEEAVAARVVEEVGGTLDSYRFSHALFRETLYDGLTKSRRARLHILIAEALERPGGPDGSLAELAHHFFEAATGSEVMDKAIFYATSAGDQAAQQLAYEDAARNYDRAVKALDLQGVRDNRVCELTLSLGTNAWNAGEFVRAKEAFRRAAGLAEELGMTGAYGRAALGFGGRMGFEIGTVDPVLINLLEKALQFLGPDQPALRSRVLARLAEALAYSGTGDRARRVELCAEARSLAEPLGDETLLAGLLGHENWAVSDPDSLDETYERSNRIIELADRSRATSLRMEGRLWRVMCSMQLGEMERMQADMAECDQLATEFRDSYYTWMVEMGSAMRCFARGEIADGEQLAWQALETGQLSQNPTAIQLFGIQMFHLRLSKGGLVELHAAAQAMAEHFVAIPAYRCALAAIYSELGLLDEAEREFELLAVNDFDQLPRDMFWLNCIDYLSYPCAALHDAERARTLYALLLPYRDRIVVGGAAGFVQGSLARALGSYAATAGQDDTAIADLEHAVETNVRAGLRHSVAEAQIDLAAVLGRRAGEGDATRADELLYAAEATATELGLVRLQECCRLQRGHVLEPAAAGGERTRLGRFATRAGGDMRAAVSTRGRAAMARLLDGSSDEELERRFGSVVAQRAVLGAMTRSFQPRMAHGFEGNVQLELTRPREDDSGRASDWWTISVARRRASVRHRTTDSAAVTIHCSVPDFIRLFSGEANLVSAWVEDRLQLEGDLILGSRLIEMFGGVKPFEAVATAA